MKAIDNQRLATVLYEVALRQQIEEDVKDYVFYAKLNNVKVPMLAHWFYIT